MMKAQLILSGVILLFVNCGAVTTTSPVCVDGKYGLSCEFTCGQCQAGSTCDKDTGLCTACSAGYNFIADPKCNISCSPGSYGDQCNGVCSGNCIGVCDHITGNCTSCKPGWTEPFCNTACSPGSYGDQCNVVCSGNCAVDCNHITGHCTSCKPGWTGSFCNTACSPGSYGDQCNGVCSGNCAVDCNHITGQCTSCKPGWTGSFCNTECENGTWGQDCLRQCSLFCTDVCNKANGVCNCQPGYIPGECTANCNGGAYGQDCLQTCGFCHGGSDTCDHVTGNCTRCQDNREMPHCVDCVAGHWGPTCGQLCGHCGGDGRCDPLDGTCLSLDQPCQDGWASPACDTECDEGSYGKNCGKKCGHCRDNTPCRHDSGICEQDCDDGYTGVLCQTEEESLLVPIVGSVIGAGFLIALAIIVVAICYARRFKSKGPQTPQKDFADILPADTDPSSSSNPHHGQHEALSLRESQVYQNMPATTSVTRGPYNNYDQTEFGRQDSHTYDTHNPPAGKLPYDPPVSHMYQNAGEDEQPSAATTGPGVVGFPRRNVAKGGQVVEESVRRSPPPPPPEANYGNLSYPAQDAPYGNLPVKKGRGGAY